MMHKKNTYLSFIALLSFFGVTGFVFGALNVPLQTNAQEQSASAIIATVPISPFIDTTLTAKSAYVFDITKDEAVFTKNETTQLPLASVAKIAVVLLATTYLESDDVITITKKSLLPEGDWGFSIGELWRAQDLIDYTLMTSSNDGAAALAESIEISAGKDIVTLLNEQAKDLGMTQTFFLNETGLDSSTSLAGAYGSAQDISILLTYAYKTAPNAFVATATSKRDFRNLSNDTVYEAVNTNKAIAQLPGLVFGKTGFTDLAGGNLAIVTETEPGHPFVIVVLGSTVPERFIDVVALTRVILGEVTD